MMKQLSFDVFSTVRKNREGSVGRYKDRQKLVYYIVNHQLLSNTCATRGLEEAAVIGKVFIQIQLCLTDH